MTEETKKETEEAVEAKTAEEIAQEDAQETAQEDAQEAAREDAQSAEKPTTEDTKEPTESAEKPTKEDAHLGITESKDIEKNTEDSSKESDDPSEEQSPAGITDDELSRVFDAIPRKSKVALNRVESKMDNVKSAKSSPTWYPWLFSIIMIIGLMWAVVYYLTGAYPIPHIGAWNLCISFVTILVGFAMTMAWK